jgi:hypothetical protein
VGAARLRLAAGGCIIRGSARHAAASSVIVDPSTYPDTRYYEIWPPIILFEKQKRLKQVTMSGFETAASAFAVVGVVDVLLRTGRDLYSFLRDVADAPEELRRLCDSIKDNLTLYETSRQCRNDLQNRTASGAVSNALISLESANKALSRELQSLKLLVAKFKGVKTWSRVKYVLNESKVSKAVTALEYAKSLLANSLTLACRFVISLYSTETSSLYYPCGRDFFMHTN